VLWRFCRIPIKVVFGRLAKGQPGRAGGSLNGKPTWLDTLGCLAALAFFVAVLPENSIRH